MANLAPAYSQVSPNYTAPEIILNFNQVSGAFEMFATGEPMVRLGDGDLYVYQKRMDIRTIAAAGQVAYNQLPSVSVVPSQINTPTYLLRVRAEYDHHDTAGFSRWGASLPESQKLGMRQGIFQASRNAAIYGMNPAGGEGIINTAGATAISLPPDSNGNDTLVTYDNGQLAEFFLTLVTSILTRMYQMGQVGRIVVLGPQRILAPMEMQNIVQLTQFQRTGAGTETSKGLIEDILKRNGYTLEWCYDDTLQGQGAGGTDAVILTVPEIKKPKIPNWNTNTFADLTPGMLATNVMYCDMVAPREIPTPLPGGAIDVLSELRITSGWGQRGEAVTVLSIQYE